MKPGGTLQTLVLFHGVPLPSARVEALSRDGSNVDSKSYSTDAHGMVFVPIDRPALWMFRVAHTVRCEGCPDAEWDTSTASYVFANRTATRPTETAPTLGTRAGLGPRVLLALLALVLGVSAWRFVGRVRSGR
jgi:hypothetical protein